MPMQYATIAGFLTLGCRSGMASQKLSFVIVTLGSKRTLHRVAQKRAETVLSSGFPCGRMWLGHQGEEQLRAARVIPAYHWIGRYVDLMERHILRWQRNHCTVKVE